MAPRPAHGRARARARAPTSDSARAGRAGGAPDRQRQLIAPIPRDRSYSGSRSVHFRTEIGPRNCPFRPINGARRPTWDCGRPGRLPNTPQSRQDVPAVWESAIEGDWQADARPMAAPVLGAAEHRRVPGLEGSRRHVLWTRCLACVRLAVRTAESQFAGCSITILLLVVSSSGSPVAAGSDARYFCRLLAPGLKVA